MNTNIQQTKRTTEDTIIEVSNLKKYFHEDDNIITRFHPDRQVKRVRAVDDVNLQMSRGETRGLVGESGCGKSTLARLLLKLHEPTSGSIIVDGEDIVTLPDSQLKSYRKRVQMVFQDPLSSLNPRYTVRKTLTEPMKVHDIETSKSDRNSRAAELIQQVGLDPEYLDRYPHEFSGGQRQRIGVARALAVEPDILVADEPTSALDVSIQADILKLLKRLQEERNLTILFISHDLSVVKFMSDNISVMYLGQIVETGGASEIFDDPKHPYTHSLLSSLPTPDPKDSITFDPLEGQVPSPIDPPSGCRFHTRCPQVIQPEELSLDQEDWHSLFQFKVNIRTGELKSGSVAAAVDNLGYDDFIDSEISPSLPARLHSTCRRAIEELITGERREAVEILDDAFTSPCETQEPPVMASDNGDVKCHLYTEEE